MHIILTHVDYGTTNRFGTSRAAIIGFRGEPNLMIYASYAERARGILINNVLAKASLQQGVGETEDLFQYAWGAMAGFLLKDCDHWRQDIAPADESMYGRKDFRNETSRGGEPGFLDSSPVSGKTIISVDDFRARIRQNETDF